MEEKNKKMTIEDLALVVRSSFEETNKKFAGVNKKIDEKIDDLAEMVQKEFISVNNKIDSSSEELKNEIKNARTDFNKKTDIFTHKDLEYRVEKLEEKIGIADKK